MRKVIFLTLIGICCIMTFTANAQTAKRKFFYTYDDAGNRIKREYTLLICPACRTAKKDSTKLVDSLFAIAQITTIELPQDPTEKVLYNGTPELKNIYPNPTSGLFIIQFTTFISNALLQVTDLNGSILNEFRLTGNEWEIDMSLFSAGEYLLVIRTNEGKVYKKKIIKI